MMKSSAYLLVGIVLCCLLLAAKAHPIYISSCDIKYDESEGSLRVQIRIFSDDLENALRKLGAPSEPGLEKNETPHPAIDDYLCHYLGENMHCWVQNQPVQFFFLEKRREQDATWITLVAEDICEFDQFRIQNTILFELFDDQTNIVRLRTYGETYNYSLNSRWAEETWKK